MIAALAVMAVAEPVLDMHGSPSLDAPVVSQTIYGTSVTALEKKPGWIRVRTADEYTGWARAEGLKEGAYAGGAMVSSLFANVYAEPDVTKRKPLVTLPFEARLQVVKEGERWIAVRLVDGREAWVQRGDIAPLGKMEITEFSKRFLGLPYLWGGVSTFGYDCSGFVQMLERRRGVMLPRDAAPQAAWSGVEKVEKAKLEPGDLVYFGPTREKVTHTGMYLGEGRFISATTYQTPVVKIDRLDDPHWAALYVGARRVK